MEERRQGTLEKLLVEMGGMKVLMQSSHDKIDQLDTKVGIQNGRVGKLEKWQSFIMGGLCILTILVLPVAFIIIREIATHVKF